MQAKPERAADLRRALAAVVPPSRRLPGVHSFDIAQDITEPNSFIATEVFADRAALTRQEELAEVKAALAMMPDCLAGAPEATVYEVSSSQPWG
jgi:quinol monooxygenase YgiN